jgi:hypothetical protein
MLLKCLLLLYIGVIAYYYTAKIGTYFRIQKNNVFFFGKKFGARKFY